MQFVKNALAAQDERTLFKQAARGRARLPDHAQVVQGADPAQLPQHDLLRQRRLRHRGRRAHLLRHRPPRLRRRRASPLRAGAGAGGGRADRRHGRLAERLRPAREPRGGRQAPRARAPADGRAGLHHARAAAGGAADVAADQQGHPAAGRGHALPVLHLLGQAAGRRQARRRPGGRPARVRGRPDGPDDARLAAPGRRRAGGRGVAALRGRPARLARRDQERHRRGARDGRRRRLLDRAVQPRDAGPAPARLRVQAVRARPGARQRHLARLHLGLAQDVALRHAQEGQVHRGVRGQQLRGRLRRRAQPAQRDDVLRQRRLRAGRHQGRHAQDRAASRAGWASARPSRATSR